MDKVSAYFANKQTNERLTGHCRLWGEDLYWLTLEESTWEVMDEIIK